jgi:hypothetical protein
MVENLQKATGYCYDLSALPALYLASEDNLWGEATTKEQSLMYHCEKKALAVSLELGVEEPVIHVNFKMCADCHACFKHASAHYKARIICNDGSHIHVFSGGTCGCKDLWR